jgi:hypothetical protein
LRIVDGAAPGTPQLDFRTPAADTTVKKRCAFSESDIPTRVFPITQE